MTGAAPRLMLAAPASGSGKTTMTCALLGALLKRGLRAASFKCGPDYIDPMFHTKVIGAKSRNLDLFFSDENTARYLLLKNSRDADISILEGVMGFYDGLGGGEQAGSYHLARATETPVVLVMGAKGQALTLSAVVCGLKQFRQPSGVAGILLNHCSPAQYERLAPQLRHETGLPVFGYLPPMEEAAFSSRHLGLVTADEIADIRERLDSLAAQLEQTVDLGGLLALARTATDLACVSPALPAPVGGAPIIAVAQDNAFCFYYEDNFALLRELGAVLLPFSPLKDAKLPEGISGLYLGGGYPELNAKALSENTSMLRSIREAVQGGLPIVAECGGFMYLHEQMQGEDGTLYPMVGSIPGSCLRRQRLVRFGYCTLTAQQDNMLCRRGEQIPAHEFHYWDSDNPGSGFAAQKAGGKSWECVHAGANRYAGYPHLYFYGNPEFAAGFVRACERFSNAK